MKFKSLPIIFVFLFIFGSSVFAQVDFTSKVSTNTTVQTTIVKAVKDVILSEDFEAGVVPPTGWTLDVTNASYTWHASAGVVNCEYDPALSPQNELLWTSAIDLTSYSNTQISFGWMTSYYWGVDPNDNYDISVEVSTDGGSTFTQLWDEHDEGVFTSYDWYTTIIDLSAYDGQVINIGFRYEGSDGAQAQFDNILVEGDIPNTETDITAYSFAEQTGVAVIDDVAHTVGIEVAYGTDVTGLVATFTLSDGATSAVGATAQVSGTTPNDFTSPVIYTVTAEDGTTTQDWTVTVTVAVSVNNIAANAIKVYPNPSNGIFNVNVENNFNLEVLDITGKVINTRVLTGKSTIEINTAGVYFFRFSNENGSVTQRVIVQ